MNITLYTNILNNTDPNFTKMNTNSDAFRIFGNDVKNPVL